MQDNRIPINANEELTLGNTRYRIQGDCIYGGNSLVYFAVDTNDGIGSRTRAIKEFYLREGAVRKNGVVMPIDQASAQRFSEAKKDLSMRNLFLTLFQRTILKFHTTLRA